MIHGAVNGLTCYAFCIMLSEREILQDWHLIKGSFQSIFWFGVWIWRSLIWVCERCRRGELLQGCWQSWSAVNQSQQKQIYNIMQSVDGNGVAVLPQAACSPSPSYFAQISFLGLLISEYIADWLEPELFPMWVADQSVCPISNQCIVWDYLLVRSNMFRVVLGDATLIALIKSKITDPL